MKPKPKMSPAIAMRLVRANAGDPKGKDPQIVDGFDWDRFGDLQKQLNPPPPGAISAMQFSERFKITTHHARDILKKKVENGEMECGSFKIGSGAAIKYFWWKE